MTYMDTLRNKISSPNQPIKIGLFILLALASYFLFSDGLDVDARRSTKALWNLGHTAYFSLLTYLFLILKLVKKLNYIYTVSLAIILSVVIGVLIEVLQYGTQREPDLVDVAHDILGCLIVLAFYPTITQKFKQKLIIFKTSVIGLCIIALWPLGIALWDETHARFQFPVLSNFSSPLEINRWAGSAHHLIQTLPDKNKPSLKVIFNTDFYSGVGLEHFKRDWRDQQYLNLNIYNPNPVPLKLTLRIHDKKHIDNYRFSDRYNHRFKIKLGNNLIKIAIKDIKTAPKTRLMNLKEILDISIFSIKYPKPMTVYIDSLYLSH